MRRIIADDLVVLNLTIRREKGVEGLIGVSGREIIHNDIGLGNYGIGIPATCDNRRE